MHFSSILRDPSGVENPLQIGRRGAARLRLSILARMITLYETRRCILLDVSRTGAQVALDNPLREGEGAFLQFANIEHFGTVVRCVKSAQGGVSGIEFDLPLSKEQVLATRRYSETFQDDEKRELRQEARKWVNGG